jgi:NADH:ubiquinone oxidoreductase subunit K
MNNRNLVRGLFLMAFALVFGLWSRRYHFGDFSRAGPGLFPLLVSCLLFLIGVITVVRSRFVERVRLEFSFRNIAIVLASLCGFVLISEHVNMIAGIVFMVFCSTYAGTSYSVVRNVKISAGLIAIAFALQELLGLNLPLI